jgi:hypothetical protein
MKHVLAYSFALLMCTACADAPPTAPPARRDYQQFQREVYPVLLRDCGFPDCHGAGDRFFRVWGPGRTRLPKADGTIPGAFDVPTVDEVSASYSLALSMVDEANPKVSELLRKPLAVEAGGASHKGVDKSGRDVYRTADDGGYVTLARWVFSEPPPAKAP